MKESENTLRKKILWAYSFDERNNSSHLNKQIIHSCTKLEEEGFGMLEDKDYPGNVDKSLSVVSPNGEIFTSEQILDYWMKRGGKFNSRNTEDMKMHKMNIYYFGFKEKFSYK